MKKSVAVILVLTLLALLFVVSNRSYTGMQVLELPPPPPLPGMESDQVLPEEDDEDDEEDEGEEEDEPTTDAADLLAEFEEFEEVSDRLYAVEQRLTVLYLLPAWEERLNQVEARAASIPDVGARIDTLDSRVDSMRVDLDNLKQLANRPFVDQPMFFGNLKSLGKRNTTLSISLFAFVLLIVAGMIASYIVERKRERIQSKKLVRQYLLNYQKTGYRMESLKMHLKASGWDDKFIEEVIKEMPK